MQAIRTFYDHVQALSGVCRDYVTAARLLKFHVTHQTPSKSRRPAMMQPGLKGANEHIESINNILFARGFFHQPELFTTRLFRIHDRLLRKLESDGVPTQAAPVPIIDWRSHDAADLLKKHAQIGLPAVIDNFDCEAWKWSLEWFYEKFGNETAPLVDMQDTNGKYTAPTALSALRNNPHLYFANSDKLLGTESRLISDLNKAALRPVLPGHRDITSQFFVSSFRGFATPMHAGPAAFVYYNIVGEKRWQLVDPYYTFMLYAHIGPYDTQTVVHFISDAFRRLLPLLRYCPYYQVDLKPRQLLWVPRYVAHAVENLSQGNLAVSSRWLPRMTVLDLSPLTSFVHTLSLPWQPVSYQVKLFERRHPGGIFPYSDVASHGRKFSKSRQMQAGWGVVSQNGTVTSRWSTEPVDLRPPPRPASPKDGAS